MPKPALEKSNKHHAYTSEQWEGQLAVAREWARQMTKREGCFFQGVMREALGLGAETVRRVLRALEKDESIVDLGRRDGWASLGAVQEEVTAARLRALIDEREDPGKAQVAPGRRGNAGGRRIERLTPSQARDAKTAINLITERAGGGDPHAVGSHWWAWDEAADDWEILDQVREWADQRARERAEKRGQPWHPRKNASARAKVVGGAKILLDLAATTGLLDRGVLHRREYTIHAAEWQPVIARWEALLIERSGRRSHRKTRQGLRTLALYATKRGQLDPADVGWGALVDQIDADHQSGGISADIMRQARWAYNHLREEGELTGPVWPTHQSTRVSLVAKSTVNGACRSLDFSKWTTGDGRSARGLTDGPFGLTSWASWVSLPSDKDLRDHGLPRRAWPRPTARQVTRMHRRSDLFRLVRSTLERRAQRIALLAGWAEANRGYDWSERTLVDLVDPDLVEAFARDRTGRKREFTPEGDLESSTASHTAFELATLCSPFLEAQAIANEDRALADKLQRWSTDLQALALRCEAEDRKEIWAIEFAWRGTSGRSGWHQLEALRNRLIEEAERLAGGRTLQDQILAIRSGEWTPTATWAVLIRDAAMLGFLRKIPVRVHSLVRLSFDMWQSEGEPWVGGIRIRFPRGVMKSKRPFRPYLFKAQHVGVDARERDFCRDLWELYLMEKGARDEILSVVEYTYEGGKGRRVETGRTVHSSSFLFPAMARRGGGHGTRIEDRAAKGFRYSEGGWSSHFSSIVMRYADDLGMDRRALDRLWGATASHVIRLLFGTYWANQPGMLKAASIMLQHARSQITEDRYCVPDASRVDLHEEVEVDVESALGTEPEVEREPAPTSSDAAEVEELRRQNAELRRSLASWLVGAED